MATTTVHRLLRGSNDATQEQKLRDGQEHIAREVLTLTSRMDRFSETQASLATAITQLASIVTGGGDPGKSALVIRMDRLEQDAIRRQRWINAAIGSSVAALASGAGLLIHQMVK